MKIANKLMVVPFVPRINDYPKEKQILSIDQDIEEILKDKTKSADQKVHLYNQALLKYNDNLSRYNLSNASEKDQSDNIFTDKLASKIWKTAAYLPIFQAQRHANNTTRIWYHKRNTNCNSSNWLESSQSEAVSTQVDNGNRVLAEKVEVINVSTNNVNKCGSSLDLS